MFFVQSHFSLGVKPVSTKWDLSKYLVIIEMEKEVKYS